MHTIVKFQCVSVQIQCIIVDIQCVSAQIQCIFWVFLGLDAFHRKESGYSKRNFAFHLDMAYKLEVQIIAWVREGSYNQFYPNTT